jgi:hypothetical protein
MDNRLTTNKRTSDNLPNRTSRCAYYGWRKSPMDKLATRKRKDTGIIGQKNT